MENDRVFKTLLINLNICYLNIKFVTNKTILMKITNDYILLRSEINNLFRKYKPKERIKHKDKSSV